MRRAQQRFVPMAILLDETQAYKATKHASSEALCASPPPIDVAPNSCTAKRIAFDHYNNTLWQQSSALASATH